MGETREDGEAESQGDEIVVPPPKYCVATRPKSCMMVSVLRETRNGWLRMASHNFRPPRRYFVLLSVIFLLGPSLSAQTKQPVTKGSPLLVDTDDTCHLFVDDEDKGVISPDHSQKFNVTIGEHILKCTVDGVPDLVWRKVVDAKESSQVAAVIALKALHLQYDQALTKAKSQKVEADAAATKQLAEAEAAEKQRPAQVLEMLRGTWHGADTVPTVDATPLGVDLQFGDGFDRVTFTDKYLKLVHLGMSIQWSTYIYKVALNLVTQNSTILKGNATCQSLKGSKVKDKDSDSQGVIKCELDKPVPITIVIQSQSRLLMHLRNRTITLAR